MCPHQLRGRRAGVEVAIGHDQRDSRFFEVGCEAEVDPSVASQSVPLESDFAAGSFATQRPRCARRRRYSARSVTAGSKPTRTSPSPSSPPSPSESRWRTRSGCRRAHSSQTVNEPAVRAQHDRRDGLPALALEPLAAAGVDGTHDAPPNSSPASRSPAAGSSPGCQSTSTAASGTSTVQRADVDAERRGDGLGQHRGRDIPSLFVLRHHRMRAADRDGGSVRDNPAARRSSRSAPGENLRANLGLLAPGSTTARLEGLGLPSHPELAGTDEVAGRGSIVRSQVGGSRLPYLRSPLGDPVLIDGSYGSSLVSAGSTRDPWLRHADRCFAALLLFARSHFSARNRTVEFS